MIKIIKKLLGISELPVPRAEYEHEFFTSKIDHVIMKDVNNYFKNNKKFIGPIGSDPTSTPNGIQNVHGVKDPSFPYYLYYSYFFYLNGGLYVSNITKTGFSTQTTCVDYDYINSNYFEDFPK